jgi:hypothetical protein
VERGRARPYSGGQRPLGAGGQPAGLAAGQNISPIQKVSDCKWYNKLQETTSPIYPPGLSPPMQEKESYNLESRFSKAVRREPLKYRIGT